MSIKTVLCAVDVSNNTRDAGVVKEAHRLAEMHGAQLDVISVVPDYGMSVVGSFFNKAHHHEVEDEARRLLNEVVTESVGADVNEKVRHIVATGSVYEEILHVAKTDKADLIVIGAHKPDFTDYLLGPNAARVVRHSRCSVYVVR